MRAEREVARVLCARGAAQAGGGAVDVSGVAGDSGGRWRQVAAGETPLTGCRTRTVMIGAKAHGRQRITFGA